MTAIERRYNRMKRKGGILEAPAMRCHVQVRPALFGCQWRISVSGEVFSPWTFAFTRNRAKRSYEILDPALVEELS